MTASHLSISTLRCSTLSLVLTSRPCRLPGTNSACLRLSYTIANLNNGDYNRNNPLIRSEMFTNRRGVNFVVHPIINTGLTTITGITPTKSVPLSVAHAPTKVMRLASTGGSTMFYCAVSNDGGMRRCARPVPLHGKNAIGT